MRDVGRRVESACESESSEESHYLSDALPVFTHTFPKRLGRSLTPPLPVSILFSAQSKRFHLQYHNRAGTGGLGSNSAVSKLNCRRRTLWRTGSVEVSTSNAVTIN